jgi:MFS family permease
MADVTVPGLASPPTTPRRAGTGTGLLLVLMSCLSVLGSVLLAPVLPAMREAFAGTPGVAALVPVTLTVPALMIGLLAPFAGRVVDRVGRKRLLVGALIAYAALGTAPLWLTSLPAIVASRAGVGVAEAAIMTCCTTLIADYFDGRERDRWLGLQTVAATIGATVFFGAGGALGAVSWRAPFWLYAASLVFAVLTAAFIRRPAQSDPARPDPARPDLAGSGLARPGPGGSGSRSGSRVELAPLPWRGMRAPLLVSLFGGIVFYAPIVELPFALDALGVTSTATIGQVSAVASLATAAGAYTFGRVAGHGPRVLLPIAFGLAAAGLILVGLAGGVPLVAAGAIIASAGTGLLLPTLLTWAISGLSYEQRGRGTGRWTAALFIGQFFCPLLVLAISGLLTGLSSALVAVGALTALMAVGTFSRGPRRAA